LNQITIDSKLTPYSSSERDLLLQHLDKGTAADMLLLNRSYPCFWMLFLLKAKGIEFCVRLKEDWWLKVKEFTESNREFINHGQKETEVLGGKKACGQKENFITFADQF
jgi:hypothetical protein